MPYGCKILKVKKMLRYMNYIYQTYINKRMMILLALGFTSGFPFLLVFGTLSFWLKDLDISYSLIGAFSLVKIPYSLKWAWSPLIDNIKIPYLYKMGRRRSWAVLIQTLLFLSLTAMAFTYPEKHTLHMAMYAFIASFLSASQDIILDAYRVESFENEPEKQASGVAIYVLGYRLGLIFSGAGAIYLASVISWNEVYLVMACGLLVGFIAILLAKEYFKKYAEIAGGDMGAGILLGVANALKNLGDWIREHIFQPFIDGFKNVFGIHSPSTVMAEMGSYLMQGLLNGISGLVERISEIWNDIKTRVRDGAQGAWDAITGIFGNVKEWFQSKFSEAWDAVKNVFSSGGAVFEGIKDGIASFFTTIVNKLIDGINRVVAIPFNAINKALNKIKSVSIAGIQPFNNLFSTISVPQLPRLATGNVAYKETVAVFGEICKFYVIYLSESP